MSKGEEGKKAKKCIGLELDNQENHDKANS